MTLAASALTHLAYAAAAFLVAAAAWEATRPRGHRNCRCGHDWDAHRHYGSSGRTYCSACACGRYHPTRPPAAGDAPAPGAAPPSPVTVQPRQPGPAARDRTALPRGPVPGHQRPTGVRIPGDDIALIHVHRTCGCMEIINPQRRTRHRQRCSDHDLFAAWARQIKETR